MNSNIRTDLAMESEALQRESGLPAGVSARRERRGRFGITSVTVKDEAGARALGKPVGS